MTYFLCQLRNWEKKFLLLFVGNDIGLSDTADDDSLDYEFIINSLIKKAIYKMIFFFFDNFHGN